MLCVCVCVCVCNPICKFTHSEIKALTIGLLFGRIVNSFKI